MRYRVLVPWGVGALVTALALWVPVAVMAQAQSGKAATASAQSGKTAAPTPNALSGGSASTALVWDPEAPPPTGWTPPRTPWGDPDLQGYYLNTSYTPLERPAALKDKALYTKEEAIAAFKKAVAQDAEVDPTTIHYDWKEYGMDAWQSPIRPNRRTSLVVDPPDGRIPPLTAEARKRQADAAAYERAKGADVQTPGLYTRCITGNGGPPRIQGGVTAESQIFQAPGYVVLSIESNYDVRIIPLDGRPHLASNVKSWLGDARGHFEGNTLVVETTNFRPDRNWRGSTTGMHLVERFTLADAKTLKYEFTVTDPTTWTKPWSAEAPIARIAPPLYEFACHESNYGLINWAKGTQIREAEGSAVGGNARAGVFQEEEEK
jgi:hypothetical protein